MNVVMAVRALTVGGAERQFVNVAVGLARRGHAVQVVVFYREDTPLEREVESAGIPIVCIAKRGRWDLVAPFLRLRRLLAAIDRPVLYSFLPVANLYTGIAARTVPGATIFWGVRSAGMAAASTDPLGRRLVRLESLCRWIPHLVVVNSAASVREWRSRGMPEGRLVCIPNGVPADRFVFDAAGRAELRAEWGFDAAATVYGAVGRISREKGLDTFLRAAARVRESAPGSRFVIVGDGAPAEVSSLRALATTLGIADALVWAGRRTDMARVYSAIDVLCLASHFEGASNVLVEAQLCGTPCVATAVGDAERILGPLGALAAPGDDAALAREMIVASRDDDARRRARRERMTEMFGLESMLDRTERELGRASGAAVPGAARLTQEPAER